MSLPVPSLIVTLPDHNNAFPESISGIASIRLPRQFLDNLLHPQSIILSSRIFQIASCDCGKMSSAQEEGVEVRLTYSIRSVG
jgi:hypothetical protein